MDLDMQRLIQAEPFLGYLGLEVVEAWPGTAVLRLRLRRDVSNHVGTVHGGAQYGLGEATAIALAATLFPEHIERLNLLTANASITYHRLARGDLTARAAIPDDARERIRAEFAERGRVRFSVAVELTEAADDTVPPPHSLSSALSARTPDAHFAIVCHETPPPVPSMLVSGGRAVLSCEGNRASERTLACRDLRCGRSRRRRRR